MSESDRMKFESLELRDKIYLNGAAAMRTEIAMRVMLQGDAVLASKILEMPLPRYQEPETFRIEG